MGVSESLFNGTDRPSGSEQGDRGARRAAIFRDCMDVGFEHFPRSSRLSQPGRRQGAEVDFDPPEHHPCAGHVTAPTEIEKSFTAFSMNRRSRKIGGPVRACFLRDENLPGDRIGSDLPPGFVARPGLQFHPDGTPAIKALKSIRRNTFANETNPQRGQIGWN